MAAWLAPCGVREVAMESTGVYWFPVFEVPDRAGFDVRLVNARATKQASGAVLADEERPLRPPARSCPRQPVARRRLRRAALHRSCRRPPPKEAVWSRGRPHEASVGGLAKRLPTPLPYSSMVAEIVTSVGTPLSRKADVH